MIGSRPEACGPRLYTVSGETWFTLSPGTITSTGDIVSIALTPLATTIVDTYTFTLTIKSDINQIAIVRTQTFTVEVQSNCSLDNIALSSTTDSFEGIIPASGSMTAVNLAFPTYTITNSIGEVCLYKIAS
jgi:hypothetical protein